MDETRTHRAPTDLLLIVGRELDPALAGAVHELAAHHALRVGFLDARPPMTDVECHRLTVTAAPGAARRFALRVARRVSRPARQMRLASRYDPWFAHALSTAEQVIALDDVADHALLVAGKRVPQALLVTSEQAAIAIRDRLAWDRLDHALAARKPIDAAADLITALRARLDTPLYGSRSVDVAGVHRFLDALLRGGRQADVLRVIPLAAELPGFPAHDATLRTYRAVSELTLGGTTAEDVTETTAGCLAVADQALAGGDLATAGVLASLALRLYFHRELHSDSIDSPLTRDPAGFVATLRTSRVWQLLTSPVASPDEAEASAGAVPQRIVVTAGTYGRFHEPVVQALGELDDASVTTVDPRVWHGTLGSMEVDTNLVEIRLRFALGKPVTSHRRVAGALTDTDAVLADWAGKTAMLASLFARPHARLVVRVHSVDALRSWLHLVDWSRVDELVCVSGHLLDLVEGLLGARLAGTRTRVLSNLIEPEGFRPLARTGEPRTLCVIGWAQRVKDPLWAVELLARLLHGDPNWRLMLVGSDFPDSGPASGRHYAAEFRRRASEPDVHEHIDYVGFTDDVPGALRRADFIISSSIRESFPLAVLEGALTGAVPVVRDWPQFAHLDAARRIYPGTWVVDDVEQAVARVTAFAGSEQFAVESRRTVAAAQALARSEQTAEAYRELMTATATPQGP